MAPSAERAITSIVEYSNQECPSIVLSFFFCLCICRVPNILNMEYRSPVMVRFVTHVRYLNFDFDFFFYLYSFYFRLNVLSYVGCDILYLSRKM